MNTHPFLIANTCYWHHEWERCGVCGVGDKPDEPELSEHLHHDEDVERERMEAHQEHAAQLAMEAGLPVEWQPGIGWVAL